jgi:hypothetical protein
VCPNSLLNSASFSQNSSHRSSYRRKTESRMSSLVLVLKTNPTSMRRRSLSSSNEWYRPSDLALWCFRCLVTHRASLWLGLNSLGTRQFPYSSLYRRSSAKLVSHKSSALRLLPWTFQKSWWFLGSQMNP